MSRVTDLIRRQRLALRMTQDSLASATGYSRNGIIKIESGGVKEVRNARRFIDALQIDPKAWKNADDLDKMDALGGHVDIDRVERLPRHDAVPVYGRAAASGEPGKLVMMNDITEYAPRPADLDDVADGYAVYVYGESMVPRFLPNERVYVHPYRPVARGDFCVVQIGNPVPECAYIKRFVSLDADEIVLEQYNPPKEIRFPRADVHSIGRIVAAGGM